MSIPPNTVEVGKCYLVNTEWGQRVRLVVRYLMEDLIEFEDRTDHTRPRTWRGGAMDLKAFALIAEREVPCDWTPEMDEERS